MHKVMTGVTDDVPQWSLPLTGGNTWIWAWVSYQGQLLQWSPPMVSGNTRRAVDVALLKITPQWSPPVTGGTTCGTTGTSLVPEASRTGARQAPAGTPERDPDADPDRVRAAMEPAIDRREQPVTGAMEPAGDGRERPDRAARRPGDLVAAVEPTVGRQGH